MSSTEKRTLPPTLMNERRRACCRRRTPDGEIFNHFATSGMVSSLGAGLVSIDISVKEQDKLGNYALEYTPGRLSANPSAYLVGRDRNIAKIDCADASEQVSADAPPEGIRIQLPGEWLIERNAIE